MADGLRYRIAAGSCALLALTWPASAAEGAPKRGGTLTYLIPADSPPSFDGHREGTFAMVHATAPFYSTLIRINPVNPSSTTDFVCDLCTGMPEPGDGGKTYVFELLNGVKFHDGTPLTAADVKASWDHIISPPEGVLSVRQSFFMMVDSVEAPDPKTVVFRLKFATTVFLPALADPRNFIYKKTTLENDPRWYEKNIEGSGPFKFASYETGQSINGLRNPDYYHPGLPYRNYAQFEDPDEVALYEKMLHETDPARQRTLMRDSRDMSSIPRRMRCGSPIGSAPARAGLI